MTHDAKAPNNRSPSASSPLAPTWEHTARPVPDYSPLITGATCRISGNPVTAVGRLGHQLLYLSLGTVFTPGILGRALRPWRAIRPPPASSSRASVPGRWRPPRLGSRFLNTPGAGCTAPGCQYQGTSTCSMKNRPHRTPSEAPTTQRTSSKLLLLHDRGRRVRPLTPRAGVLLFHELYFRACRMIPAWPARRAAVQTARLLLRRRLKRPSGSGAAV